jgi:2-polyprenyl-6-methoxyphenol hydroxylase-like FAD-dependent oxidoreductase
MATTILGGGIAATALATALAAAGREATAFERHAADAGGAFLVLDQRGHDALGGLGVDVGALRDASRPVHALAVESTDSPSRRRELDGSRLYQRAELMGVLQSAAREAGADIRYRTPITSITVEGHSTVLQLEDADVAADGLVVGADGIDSVARAVLEPQRSPQYAGQVVLYGKTDHPLDLPTEAGVLHFHNQALDPMTGLASSTLGHVWHSDGDCVQWFARLTRPAVGGDELGERPVDEWADTLLAAVPAFSALAGWFLKASTVVQVTNARNVPLDEARPARVPVVLVGDADHAITPAAGVGARDAVEDVAAVYQAIVDDADVAAALNARRARIRLERERIAAAYASMREHPEKANGGCGETVEAR